MVLPVCSLLELGNLVSLLLGRAGKERISLKLIYEKQLTSAHEAGVWNLLASVDSEFVPPLSSRESTTDRVLFGRKTGDNGPKDYFETMKKQSFILAVQNDTVIGFLSFIPDHSVMIDGKEFTCDYVSTLAVAREERGRGITRKMYTRLFLVRPNRCCATRTWSLNEAHLRILHELGFRLASRLPDDRGQGIDTVYYIKTAGTKHDLSPVEKIRAYKLGPQTQVTVLLMIASLAALVLYCFPACRSHEILSGLILAFFTSCFVAVLTLGASIFSEFKNRESETFLEDMRFFGIGELSRDKRTLLTDLLSGCKKAIWISGYRLILSSELRNEFAAAVRRGARLTAVICPPWSEAYRLVYGSDDYEIDNYFNLFKTIYDAIPDRNDLSRYEVLFIEKPLFSDTYRFDRALITGPYMHNKDNKYGRITARDFFSYSINRKSELFKYVKTEYETLGYEASQRLDWEKFELSYALYSSKKLSEAEKEALFREACVDRMPAPIMNLWPE